MFCEMITYVPIEPGLSVNCDNSINATMLHPIQSGSTVLPTVHFDSCMVSKQLLSSYINCKRFEAL